MGTMGILELARPDLDVRPLLARAAYSVGHHLKLIEHEQAKRAGFLLARHRRRRRLPHGLPDRGSDCSRPERRV